MLCRIYFTMKSEMTIEADTLDEAEHRMEQLKADAQSRCHHGEVITAQLRVRAQINGKHHWVTLETL